MTTAYGYKLFNKDTRGNLHPLYVNANQIIPVNQWLAAECGEKTEDGKVKSKLGKLAYRGGWHLNEGCPYVTHIYGKKYCPDGQEIEPNTGKRFNKIQKPNTGFVAYAYTAYLKAMEKAEKEKQLKEEAANTEYYGKVGDKITVEVTGKIVGSYETSYGYYGQTVRIWEFTDAENHIFIWKTSSFFAVDNEEKMDDEHIFHGKIKATIKEHSEYRGKKQTVITRVKAV